MGLLDGHRALVTGGASGIGAATCRRMAEEGARIAIVDINGDGAEVLAHELDGVAYRVDVTDFDAFNTACLDAATQLGGLTLLFNNAGASNISRIHEFDLDEWNRVVQLCLTGVFHGFKAVVPIMLQHGGGSIVSTASISGTRPAAGEAPYSAAKAGVIALTANAALEYAPDIRVNAVSPGMILTALTAPLFQAFPDIDAAMIAKTPAARVGTPEDVADVVVFLCSDLARFVTGQNIVVDGGMTLHGSGVDGVLNRVDRLLGR